MFASFQKKYFLSDKGVAGVKRGIFWTTLTNLITMAGMGFLFLVMAGFVEHLASGADLPDALPIVGGLLVFFVLLFASNWQQYYYTYCIFYEECGKQRMEIAERLRKLPLSFFGRRDLADLTETIMGDVQAMEHAYSHVLGELWGAIIASAIVFVASLFFCWQLAIAAFWSVPVAFAVLYLTRGPMTPVFDRVRAEKVKVTEAIQETLDCVREIRATNQEAHYLEGLNVVIDAEERETTKGELANGLLVNSAFVILRLGIATTLVTGAAAVASGQVDFLVMFAFLLMVSRIYVPFDQALMLMSELFAAESSAKRMRSIMEEPVARGSEKFEPAGHDVVFDHVAFGYGAGEDGRAGEKVLTDVSFTAKEGEVTALVGPSGSGKSTVSRLAARFWDATAGKVTVGGVDVASVDPEVLLRDYAIVFQDVLLFDDTVMGNIRLGRRDATDEEVLGRRACRQLRRVREPHAAGLRHHDRRERLEALRRRAPAHLHRPRAAQRRAHRAVGRGDGKLGRGERDRGPGGALPPARGQDRHRDRAPHAHGRERRQDRGPEGWRGRRAGHACRSSRRRAGSSPAWWSCRRRRRPGGCRVAFP